MSPAALVRLFRHMPGNHIVLRADAAFTVVATSAGIGGDGDLDGGIGKGFFDMFPERLASPGAADVLRSAFGAAVASGSAQQLPVHRYDLADAADGRLKERYWTATVTPVPDADGQVEYLVYTPEDASASRATGAMAVLDAMSEGFYIVDRQWRFTYANPGALRILGTTREAIVGGAIFDIYPGLSESAFGHHYRHTMATGERAAFEAFYPPHARWYEVTVNPAPEGIAVYFRNITDRVSAEEQRQAISEASDRQRRIYETALNSTPDFVYVFDLEHRAQYANDALRRVWGVNDVRGRTWMDLGYEQWHADLHDRELALVIQTGAPIRGEIPFKGTNGTRVYDYIFSPVLDADGHVVAVAGTTRDVTDRQAAEQALRRNAERLAESDRMKDEFLATLSHELRNPLAPLRNGLEILRMTTAADARAASVHAMMERQVGQMIRLVDDLLEVSRISRGTLSIKRRRLTLDSVLDVALDGVRPLVEQNAHRLQVDVPAQPVWLFGDQARLAQIVSNVLTNAARYTPRGGSIRLRASTSRDDAIIVVEDDGAGMEPATIPRMFEMFSRGARDSTLHQGGLGIGLALARQLVELHGGSIEARSAGLGQGTTVTIRVPLSEAPEPTAGPGGDAPRALDCKILVVDDNHDVADSLAEALRLFGAEVCVEYGGEAALEAMQRFMPGVAILDIGMPGMNGYDLARRLRGLGVTAPLIALTGWGQDADRKRAFASGFDHHLVKPVSVPGVVELVGRVCAA